MNNIKEKKCLVFALCFALFMLMVLSRSAWAAVAIDNAHFPDSVFRSYVGTFDTNANGTLDDDEITAVTEIVTSASGMTSLKGIEYFTSLRYLNFWGGSIDTVDLSAVSNLVNLDCVNDGLTSIVFPANSTLQYVKCKDNQLTNLDLSQQTSLVSLDCMNNNLTALSVNSGSLVYLECGNNQLTGISGLGNCINLEELGAWTNNLQVLDVSKNTKLRELRLYNSGSYALDLSGLTQLASADVNTSSITSLTLGNNTSLRFLNVAENRLTALDAGSDVAPNLTTLWCGSQNSNSITFIRSGNQYVVNFDSSAASNIQLLDSNGNILEYTLNGTYIYTTVQPSTLKYDYNTRNSSAPTMDVTASLSLAVEDENDSDEPNSAPDDSYSYNDSNGSDSSEGVYSSPDLSTELLSKIASKFGISSSQIFTFSPSEILSNSGSLSAEDAAAIRNLNETVIFITPTFMPNNSGVYIMMYSINSSYAGKVLRFHGISSSSNYNSGSDNSIGISALENPSYAFYDANYNEITEVPSDGIIYAAVNMTAGRASGGVITTPKELMSGTIEPIPVEDQETLRDVIAKTLNDTWSTDISPEEILFITEENILGEAVEPTQTLKDEAKSDNNELVGKLSTLSVDESGYYAFKVILSDDLYESVKDTRVENLNIYYIQYDEGEYVPIAMAASDGKIKVSFITGLLNTFELLTMSGEKMQFGMKKFLMVGFLNAGKPMSLYIAKLILALLLGGCNTGIVPAISLALLGVIVLKHRKNG